MSNHSRVMGYNKYSEEDFIADEYFQRWVLDSNSEIDAFWNGWLRKHPEKKEVVNSAIVLLKSMDNEPGLSEMEVEDLWENILQQRNDTEQGEGMLKMPFYGKRIFQWGVAASLLGFLFTIFTTELLKYTDNEILELPENAIILELQDGTHQILDEKGSDVIIDPKGRRVKQDNNRLVYDAGNQRESKVEYNELKVPFGKKFEIVLSDGSHVFLNSGTSLKYPVAFANGTNREVYLDGEAYFSVAQEVDRPFIVITKSMNTQVYGTKFNVSSYSNENNTTTVLVEGSVGVYPSGGNRTNEMLRIVPGERALLSDDHIMVDKVNVKKYTAWTTGQLFFNDDEFNKILKELERHFDVVIHNGIEAMNHKKFTGTFTHETIEEILNVFQEHTPFEYTRNEKVITIYMVDKP